MNDHPTMRIVTQTELGDPTVLTLGEAPVPSPGPSRVLVKVAATSLNPTDWVHRRRPGFLGDRPKVLGWDVAGTVEAVGTGVTLHPIGDRVFGMLPYPAGHGAAAEYVLAPARALVPVPERISLPGGRRRAAGRSHGLAGPRGHRGRRRGRPRADPRRSRRRRARRRADREGPSAHAIGTASARNQAMIERLDVHEAIDSIAQAFEEVVHDVDLVLEPGGKDVTERSLAVVRRGDPDRATNSPRRRLPAPTAWSDLPTRSPAPNARRPRPGTGHRNGPAPRHRSDRGLPTHPHPHPSTFPHNSLHRVIHSWG